MRGNYSKWIGLLKMLGKILAGGEVLNQYFELT